MLRIAKMHPLVHLREFFVALFEEDVSLHRIEGVGEVYFLANHLWVILKFFQYVSPGMHYCFTSPWGTDTLKGKEEIVCF